MEVSADARVAALLARGLSLASTEASVNWARVCRLWSDQFQEL